MHGTHALLLYVRITADQYCAVEFISVIKASRLVTIEVENQSPTLSTSDIEASLHALY